MVRKSGVSSWPCTVIACCTAASRSSSSLSALSAIVQFISLGNSRQSMNLRPIFSSLPCRPKSSITASITAKLTCRGLVWVIFDRFNVPLLCPVISQERTSRALAFYEYTLLARCMRPSSCARARCHARHLRGGASRIRLAWRDAGARSTGIKLARVRGARPIRRVRAAHWPSDSAAMTMCKITTPARARREAQTARWPTFATQYR